VVAADVGLSGRGRGWCGLSSFGFGDSQLEEGAEGF
jgi:hypothetical protein